MKIESLDIYWVKLPVALVWKTPSADQHDTDTVLVRIEGDGHDAWGESCPPYIPGYSADHLAMIEQPLADDGMSLINHADLQKRIETPVCLSFRV